MTATIEATVRDRYGLHPRAALRIQQVAAGFASTVTLQAPSGSGSPANATSLISLVSAGIGPNEPVRITATGDDADAALEALRALLEGGICHP
jgi:phosphotransferase system HPr (HPr) family protein